ncbi:MULTISPECIES: ATP-binding protein [Novosphingobium]|uniref:ATP-binding protein n=1 Tax=Novosphingobium TaxID=165696 RepID=UPI0035B16ED7
MIESLRGLGYSTSTALADIIDNSISANASEVDIRFEWNDGDGYIHVLDNGDGMDDSALENAMQLGAKNPLEERSAHDLGRFGLGLKTASFSQARRLTVSSKARDSNEVACLRWDLDLLSVPGDEGWHLFEGPDPLSITKISPLSGHDHGTLVLWEKLDRIITSGFTVQDFLDLQDEVERHLAMTFHRLLAGESDALVIRINGKRIVPWDPFMEGHPSKAWASPEFVLAGSTDVRVQCHVLPHKDMLNPRELTNAAGPAGWIVQQGFYIYRNKRLLVAGGWLGLEADGRSLTRDEPHRLARIRLDIPNSADAEWKIDIRKSAARPPVRFRKQLLRLALETRDKARQVFAHRGQWNPAATKKPVAEAWVAEKSRGSTRYRISRSHEAVASLMDRAGPLAKDLEALLRIIEETVPVQRIWLDTVDDRETPRNGFAEAPAPEVLALMQGMFRNLVEQRKLSPDEARARLMLTAPFDRFPDLVTQLTNDPMENFG